MEAPPDFPPQLGPKGLARYLADQSRRDAVTQTAALVDLVNATQDSELAEAVTALAPVRWATEDVGRNRATLDEARALAVEALKALHGWSLQWIAKPPPKKSRWQPVYAGGAAEKSRTLSACKLANARLAALVSAEPRVPRIRPGALTWVLLSDEADVVFSPVFYVAGAIAAATDPETNAAKRIHRCLNEACGRWLFDDRPILRGTGKSYCKGHASKARKARSPGQPADVSTAAATESRLSKRRGK